MRSPADPKKWLAVLTVIIIILGLLGFSFFKISRFDRLFSHLGDLESQLTDVSQKQNVLDATFEKAMFEDHIKISENIKLASEIERLSKEIEELNNKKDNQEFIKINEIYKQFADFKTKMQRHTAANLKTTDLDTKVTAWGDFLLNKKFDELKKDIADTIAVLDKSYKDYLATLPPPVSSAGPGYSFTTVTTEKGKFGVYLLKVSLSSVKVVTAAANGSDCKDNCPTKSLAEHVKDNGGYAGMNGTYFCPPDYANCSGKVNSFDYAFYKSSDSKWLNKHALAWGDTGLATFSGHSAKFYKKSSDFSGSVSAGISNFPTLLSGGNIAIDNGIVTEYQKLKGRKGVIGKDESNLYLALINSASIDDAAHVMKALGAKDALNIDGGGSGAMYINGSYVVGPGRSLPNAIVLVK